MMGKSFLEHILNDRDDRAFERHPRQLSGTACGLRKIVADAECNGAQCSIAVGKSYALGARSDRGNGMPVMACSSAFLSG